MNHKRLALLGVLVWLLGSCGSDGGSSGTGITTAAGNVASVQVGSALMARAPESSLASGLGGIRVTIEGTSIAGETDERGLFRVRGVYDSEVTLLYTRAADGLSARWTVNIPSGGTLTLHDVVIDGESGTATPASQDVAFAGIVVEVDCAGGTLRLVSQQDPTNDDVYDVVLAGSVLLDPKGQPVACATVEPGSAAEVTGVVNPDGSFGDARVVLSD